MSLVYIPVFSEAFEEFNWWTGKYLDYQNCLVSYYYARNRNIREEFNMQKAFVIGDSGGYQAITQNVDINPMQVMKWAERNKNNYQMILDRPPFQAGGVSFGQKFPVELFNQCMEITASNGEKMVEIRQDKEVKLFGIIQGETLNEIKKWHERLEQNVKYDGIALSVKPAYNPIINAIYLAYAIENIDKPIHTLQISGANTLPVLAYATKFLKFDITTDSSAFAQGNISRKYMIPFSYQIEGFTIGNSREINLIEQLCDCNICKTYSIEDMKNNGRLISLHNLNYMIKKVKFLNILAKDSALFKEFVNRNCSTKTIEAIRFIDLAKEKGVDKAYKQIIEKQKSLSAFT